MDQVKKIKIQDFVFYVTGLIVLIFSFSVLMALIVDMFSTGWPRVDQNFFFSFPSRFAEKAGIFSAWVGSVAVVVVTRG